MPSLTDGEIRRALKQVEQTGKQLSLVEEMGRVAEDYLPLHQWFDVIWTVKPRCRATIKVRPQR